MVTKSKPTTKRKTKPPHWVSTSIHLNLMRALNDDPVFNRLSFTDRVDTLLKNWNLSSTAQRYQAIIAPPSYPTSSARLKKV